MAPAACVAQYASMNDADNAFYDAACELLMAAQAFQRIATDPDTPAPSPAIHGCLEAAFSSMGVAAAQMYEDTPRPTRRSSRNTTSKRKGPEWLRDPGAELISALRRAEGAARVARRAQMQSA